MVQIYGLLTAVIFGIALWRYYRNLQLHKMDTEFFVHHCWRWLLGALVVGRLGMVLLDRSIIAQHGIWGIFSFWEGGIHFFFTLLGGLFMLLLDTYLHRKDALRWLDIAVLPFFFGMMLRDIAGFITGGVYGTETSLPWGIRYETFDVDVITPVHPVTLYALVLHFLVFRYLQRNALTIERKRGRMAIYGGILFSISTFILQFFRGDSTLYLFGTVRLEQLMAVLALVVLFLLSRRYIQRDS